ncbi:hypothetical protein ACWGJT_28245 [Streptomyces xantholiticus]
MPDLWIASAMACVLGTTLSATASAPAETIVAEFTRELRIVLRLTREPSSRELSDYSANVQTQQSELDLHAFRIVRSQGQNHSSRHAIE